MVSPMNAKPYQTSDIALAAFLLTSGFNLHEVEAGRRAVFSFVDKPDLPKQVMQFINGQSTVEPGLFLNNLKTLKGMANGY